MKNLPVLSVLVAAGLLTACTLNKSTAVVSGMARSTAALAPLKQVDEPANLPSNVTAVCRDGSYSTALENACSGSGGVAIQYRRYFSE